MGKSIVEDSEGKNGLDRSPRALDLPKTPVGVRAQDLIDMLNATEPKAIDNFINSRLSAQFRTAIPSEEHRVAFSSLKTEHPRLRLRYHIELNDRRLVLYFESAKNHRWVQLEMEVEKSDPGRIDNIFFHPLEEAPDPDLMTIDGGSLNDKERELIVKKVGKLMVDHYVFPKVGQSVSKQLIQSLNNGDYDKFSHAGELSKQLTGDIRKIAHDKHVHLFFQERDVSASRSKPKDAETPLLDHGIAKAELLPGNIGFIDLRHFEPAKQVKKTFAKAMKAVDGADAIIFDMRKNGGGAPEGVQLLCSYLFDKRIHLNNLYWRKGNRTEEFWTLDEIEGRKRPDVPVFVLTSNRTFSGAEEFTYNLKLNKRATIVGEVTGGGANPGGSFDIIPRMGIFISTGRAINPITGTNWEGKGIQPDIKVEAAKALEAALELAKAAAKKYSQIREK